MSRGQISWGWRVMSLLVLLVHNTYAHTQTATLCIKYVPFSSLTHWHVVHWPGAEGRGGRVHYSTVTALETREREPEPLYVSP